MLIELVDLEFRYPASSFQLRLASLKIEPGERVAVVGPSGCGKTTLLNLISGIAVPNAGQVLVGGQCVSAMPDDQRRDFRCARIGQVFQQFELVEYLSMSENIRLPFLVNRSVGQSQNREQVQQRVVHLAEAMGLGDKLDRTPSRLSQGEQQRLAICRALINEPLLILADEPTGNLDPANKKNSLKYLLEYCDRTGSTLVVVTHDTSILSQFTRTIEFEQLLSQNKIQE